MSDHPRGLTADEILAKADKLQSKLGGRFRDRMVVSLYDEADRIASRAVRRSGDGEWDLDQRIDRIVTSRIFGLPIMFLILSCVIWITKA